jgi:hypothetical protein
MINAGIAVLAFNGAQTYNPTTSHWENILVQVKYPTNQTVTNNPISSGDLLLETNGRVWTVVARTLLNSATCQFKLELILANATPSEEVSPEFGGSIFCAIVTPKKGIVAPYWEASLVNSEISRIANMYNADINVRDNTADIDKPISTLVQAALNNKMNSGAVDLGNLPPVI